MSRSRPHRGSARIARAAFSARWPYQGPARSSRFSAARKQVFKQPEECGFPIKLSCPEQSEALQKRCSSHRMQ
jgi:hypothetical protein